MLAFIKRVFRLNHVKAFANLDAPETTILHGEIIRSKEFLKKIYEDHYRFFLKKSAGLPRGLQVEIGSGAGFIKSFLPEVITSDILPLPNVDTVFSALDSPFKDEELSAIYMIDVLHHLPDALQFFREAERTLLPGGKIIMVEPANTFWARFIYKNFHHEPFEPNTKDWKLPPGGPMSIANGALPWIIFVRDRKQFDHQFPNLTLESIEYCQPIRYLISGGVSMKQLLPSFMYPFIVFLEEKILWPFAQFLGMFMKVVVKKNVPCAQKK